MLGGFEATIFLLTAVFAITYIYLKYYVYNYWKRHGIPQEDPSILLGNIPLSYLLGKMTLGNVFERNSEKLRKFPFHGFYVFQRPMIVVNDAEHIRLVLVKEFSKFANRGIFASDKVDPLTGNLFLQTVEKWAPARKMFSPTFTPGKLRNFHVLMLEVCNEMIKACDKDLRCSNIVEVKDIIARYTTDIISSVIYGFNCNSLANPNSDFRRYGIRAFELGRFNLLIGLFLPEIHEKITVPLFPMEVRNFFINVFQETIEHRRKEKIVRHDFIDLLMQLMDSGELNDDDKEPGFADESKEKNSTAEKSAENPNKLTMSDATAQTFNFFLAGYETTSTTATLCLLELAMNPEIQQKLQQEIDEVAESDTGFTYDSIMSMEYLEMVFQETLRKHPPVPFMTRICTEDCPLPESSYAIPKGMRVVVPVASIHHDPTIFPEPEKFDPSRFAKENVGDRSPYVTLGFGAGARNCIATRFGTLQSKQAIATLLYNYNIYVSDKTTLPLKLDTEYFVVNPKGGLYLRLEKRRT